MICTPNRSEGDDYPIPKLEMGYIKDKGQKSLHTSYHQLGQRPPPPSLINAPYLNTLLDVTFIYRSNVDSRPV